MKIINLDQQNIDWLAWRGVGIGSSDVSAILGISKFTTAYQLYLQKKNIAPAFKGNAATQAGNDVEAKARAVYEITHGEFEEFKPICLEHSEYPFMRASLDGYSHNLKRILEIKYPSKNSHSQALLGEVPEHYLVQVQYQLGICDEATHAHYWSYREGAGALVEIKRDQKMLEEIIWPAVIAFKGLLDSNTPPPLTEEDALWIDDEFAYPIFEELIKIDSKEKRDKISQRILETYNHPKIASNFGRVTSVKRNGIHSYYRITFANEDPEIKKKPEWLDANSWWNRLGEIEKQKA